MGWWTHTVHIEETFGFFTWAIITQVETACWTFASLATSWLIAPLTDRVETLAETSLDILLVAYVLCVSFFKVMKSRNSGEHISESVNEFWILLCDRLLISNSLGKIKWSMRATRWGRPPTLHTPVTTAIPTVLAHFRFILIVVRLWSIWIASSRSHSDVLWVEHGDLCRSILGPYLLESAAICQDGVIAGFGLAGLDYGITVETELESVSVYVGRVLLIVRFGKHFILCWWDNLWVLLSAARTGTCTSALYTKTTTLPIRMFGSVKLSVCCYSSRTVLIWSIHNHQHLAQ